MLSKNKIKEIISLQRKKKRKELGLYLVEGDKMAREAIEQDPGRIKQLYAVETWIQKYQRILYQEQVSFHTIEERALAKISTLKTPNQVLLLMEKPQASMLPANLDQKLSLYLDDIQDPGNMGTILRIADWFGIKTVICSANCVDVYSPKVVQATMGATFRIVTLEESLVKIKEQFPKINIYGTLLEGENLFEAKLEPKGIIVIGNEGRGMNPENIALVTRPISIPKSPDSDAESLNAAIATGIVCAFFNR